LITHLIEILLLIKVSFGIASPYSKSLIYEDEPIKIPYSKDEYLKNIKEENELTI
jgi:hypothetical protein